METFLQKWAESSIGLPKSSSPQVRWWGEPSIQRVRFARLLELRLH